MKTIGAQIVATPPAGYAGCCAAIPKIDVTKRLGEIKCPILVIAGEQDMATPLAMAKEMHSNAPGSTLAVLSPAAHLSNIEQPEAFSAALDGVLKRAA
jgi:3-oxoadipate enol-lactonase